MKELCLIFLIFSILLQSGWTYRRDVSWNRLRNQKNQLAIFAGKNDRGIITGKKFLSSTVSLIAIASSVFSPVNRASAGWFGPSEVEQQINGLCSCQKQVYLLHQQLSPSLQRNSIGVEVPMQLLKGGVEDSGFVQVVLDSKLKPCQETMEKLTPQLTKLDEESKKKIQNLPLLMKGHLLELQQAVTALSAEEQEKEVAEVEETLDEYLKLASSQYEVKKTFNVDEKKYVSDKEYYGLLGCEFWGKVRVDGSKNCISKEEAEARAVNQADSSTSDQQKSFTIVNQPLLKVRPPVSTESSAPIEIKQ